MMKKGTLGFTAKAVSDRIKSKDLEKLKWYCQMCEKQCQNANEFKLHSMSDDHERQMQMYIQNPSMIKEIYSHKFEKAFLEHLRCHHPSSPVAATVVYDEMIIAECNRRDVNLSSTKWASLAEFVRDLGVTGKCVVKGTPQGWFVSCNNVVD